MKLSPDEEAFLRHWIYDEAHYLNGVGPAKRLQIDHKVAPADIATLIAASMPSPADQREAAAARPATTPTWPWTGNAFQERLGEARELITR